MRENVIPLIVVKANTQRARGRLQKRKQTHVVAIVYNTSGSVFVKYFKLN